jgi:hypothetical protein
MGFLDKFTGGKKNKSEPAPTEIPAQKVPEAPVLDIDASKSKAELIERDSKRLFENIATEFGSTQYDIDTAQFQKDLYESLRINPQGLDAYQQRELAKRKKDVTRDLVNIFGESARSFVETGAGLDMNGMPLIVMGTETPGVYVLSRQKVGENTLIGIRYVYPYNYLRPGEGNDTGLILQERSVTSTPPLTSNNQRLILASQLPQIIQGQGELTKYSLTQTS